MNRDVLSAGSHSANVRGNALALAVDAAEMIRDWSFTDGPTAAREILTLAKQFERYIIAGTVPDAAS